jgi:hypothetical protein
MMTREQARKLARQAIKLSEKERKELIDHLDTESRTIFIEEMYYLKGDMPPGKVPNCS